MIWSRQRLLWRHQRDRPRTPLAPCWNSSIASPALPTPRCALLPLLCIPWLPLQLVLCFPIIRELHLSCVCHVRFVQLFYPCLQGSQTPALPTGQRSPLTDAIAPQHAVPAAAVRDLPESAATPAVSTGQENPLLDAIAEQHALPQTDAKTSGGGIVSRLSETDLAERTGGAQPTGMQSGWLTSWFRKGAQAPQQAAPSGIPDSRSNSSSQSGAGTVSRLGHSLTTSFGSTEGPSTTPLVDSAQVCERIISLLSHR